MKFQFDPNLDYQINAIDSVCKVFEGHKNTYEDANILLGNGIIPNTLRMSKEEILENTQDVQETNGINDLSYGLESMNFSIEMETGTGKTYVYLRTILELREKYGWQKFIVVVPSVAIREGVIKTLEQTEQHFDKLYEDISYNYFEYDSDELQQVRHFARNNEVEIMVITLQSFNKGEDNIMFQQRDTLQGKRPVDFIEKSKPILILDEPQNMESKNSKEAISELNPLFTLRYSATHRNTYNLLYQLGPYEAYRRGLVKHIDVLSVVKENEFNTTLIQVDNIKTGEDIKARLTLHKDLKSGIKKGKKTVRLGDSLYEASKGVDNYEGMKVTNIEGNRGFVEFSDGTRVFEGESTDTDIEKIQRLQIRETIKEHFEKALDRHDKGIKVLSLFFIDRVSNYKDGGHLKKAFEEEFNRLKKKDRYSHLYGDKTPTEVCGSYFSEYKTEERIKDDTEAFELIMKDKEKLLSLDEPTEFIFSHSALREGWDSPNVFNICTLNNTVSRIRKRQEIGRGVRIPLNQEGDRVFDTNINILTVIANESYDDYVAQLQTQYEEETGRKDDVSERIKDRRERIEVSPKESVKRGDEFQELWDKISIKTRYKSKIKSNSFVKKAAQTLSDISVNEPQIKISKAEVKTKEADLEYETKGASLEMLDDSYEVPNIIQEISEELGITKRTVRKILEESETLEQLFKNPQDYLRKTKRIIGNILEDRLVKNIEYVETDGNISSEVFKDLKTYLDRTVDVDNSIYPKVIADSKGEAKFAERLDKEGEVNLFIKLPPEFKVPTPIGSYNPDWAIVFSPKDQQGKERGVKLYLIKETKFVDDIDQLRDKEKKKIECARAHFDAIDVDYDVITDLKEKLLNRSKVQN